MTQTPERGDSPAPVRLVEVDETTLAELVAVATSTADADEVTPAITPGEDWTPPRVAWLRQFHRDRRAGLDGPRHEATFAVVIDEDVVGSVRLRRQGEPCCLETGIWLSREIRGNGVATRALEAIIDRARMSGAHGRRRDDR